MYFAYPLRATEINPGDNAIISLDAKRFVFRFNRPILRQNVQAVISPDIPGEWRFEDPLIGDHLYQTIVFVPFQTMKPETDYQFHIGTIRAIGSASSWPIPPLAFRTESLPAVASDQASITSEPLSVNAPIVFRLTSPVVSDAVAFSAQAVPSVSLETSLNHDKTQLIVRPLSEFNHAASYEIKILRTLIEKDRNGKILRTNDPEEIYSTTFQTVTYAGIETVLPQGNTALPSDPIRISFSKAMNRVSVEENITVAPPFEYTVSWDDDQRVQIQPKAALSFGTSYTLTLPDTIQARDGSRLPTPLKHSYSTIGVVSLSNTTPTKDAQGVSVSSDIRLVWNQGVEQSSIDGKIALSPNISHELIWDDDQTLRIHPTEKLAFETLYAVRIVQGVRSKVGAPESSEESFSFLTEPQVFKLNIPLDYQDKKLSCEAGALKMALAGKGVKVSETDIMNIVGYDPTKKAKGVWGNPYKAFVGDINGKQNSSGYGVYWEPIAKAAKTWRPNSESFTGWSLEQIVSEVAKGNPVEFWGTMGPAYRDDWKTPDGQTILAWKGEHTRTLIGFVGSRENPQTLIINDPIAGVLYWSKDQFLDNWKRFNNSGVVVR